MKKIMRPNSEHQTMHPARHLSRNMKMKEMTTAPPRATSSHRQLLMISVMKLLRSPWLNAAETVLLTVEKIVLNMLALGTHNLPTT
jgi:hypothetical protein